MTDKTLKQKKKGVTHTNTPQTNSKIKEQNKLYFQKWSILFLSSIFFVLLSIFLVVVENNSFSGYKSYAHQQYKRSLSSIQKSVNNLSSIINKSNENLRQKRSYIEHDDYSESFKLIYPYQSIVLAQDSIQEIKWKMNEKLKNKKMDIILKSVKSSNEEIVVAKEVKLESKEISWNLNYDINSGNYNLVFRLSNDKSSFLGSSPEITILSLTSNDKNYYPRLIKFTYPFAPMEWRINDNSLITWNPLPFASFSTTFKLSVCKLISKERTLDISEILIHPEVQASNGYFKVNLKKVKGISPGGQYFFKASFSSGVFEVSSLFTVVDDTLEITNYNKEIQIITPFTSTLWKVDETVNISLNIKRYTSNNLSSSFLRLTYVDLDNINNNDNDNTFITQFSITKKKNSDENYIIKIKDIKDLEDSQIIWKVPKTSRIGYYSIQLVKTDENNDEIIIDQTSPIIEIIP